MRKFDRKNKLNIAIIIGVSLLIIVMFGFMINYFINSDKKEYNVIKNTILFDNDKTLIKIDKDSTIKTKWNNDFYLKYNKKNYNLGNPAIGFSKDSDEVLLFGKFYEINSSDEIKVINNNTKVNTSLTKFYKLDDRKYLLIDKSIKSLDNIVSTNNFLIVNLDRAGNATLVNNEISLKTFSETTLVTSNYSFDIANEILTYGTDKIDLKKIIGSSNEYTKEDLIPDKVVPGSGDGTTIVKPKPNPKPNNKGDGNGTGNGVSGGGNTVVEEIKKASKKTSIVSITPYIDKIDVDYVVYDPYNEYIDIYMEINKEGSNSIDTIHLNRNETKYSIGKNILPNTKYNITFKVLYINPDTKEEVRDTIDKIVVNTKLPNIYIKATSTSFGKIGYQITVDNSYSITSGTLTVLVNDKIVSTSEVKINGNTLGSIMLDNYNNDDIIELRLDNIKSLDYVIPGLKSSYMFKY